MKKLLVAFVFGVAAVSANAAYLYWQIIDDVDNAASASAWSSGGWATAKLYSTKDSGNAIATATRIYDEEEKIGGTPTQKTTIEASVFSGSSYSFYVELLNSKSEVVARSSQWQTYASLKDQNIIIEVPDLETTHATWGGGSFVAAPEPTSAMLMLLGVAGLALRRKQRKLA